MAGPRSTLSPASLPTRAAKIRGVLNPFPLTGEESIRLTSYNSLAGVKVVLHGRILDDDDNPHWFRYTHTPNTDRSAKSEDFAISKGLLTNVVAFVEGASPLVGQTFIQVRVVIGQSGATFLMGTLLQDYVTAQSDLAWPGSPLRTPLEGGGYVRAIIGTFPAPITDVVETVPTNARWELVSLFTQFVASAVVAPRLILLSLQAPSFVPLVYVTMQATIAASQSSTCNWYNGAPFSSQNIGGNLYELAPVPPASPLLAGGRISVTSLYGYQAGDQFIKVYYSVREWIAP